MTPQPEDSTRDWIERVLIKMREAEATPDEVRQLRTLLTEDASARRIFLRAKQLDTLLETTPGVVSAETSRKEEKSRAGKGAWLVGAAVLAGLAVFGWWRNADEGFRGPEVVAVLKSSFEAVVDGREVLPGERPMVAGTYKLERGSVELQFGSGARVVIEGPAAFDLVDGSTMHLNQGSLWSHCPPEARGFTVRMPGGREIVDYGTEFGARVDPAGTGEVKVMEGEVKVHDAVAKTLDLTAGSAAGWELTSPPLAMNAASVKPFQSAEILAERVKSAPQADLQTIVLFQTPKGGDWNVPENWDSGSLPGAHELERAVINQSRVVRVLPGLPSPPHPVDLNLSNGPPPFTVPDATLEIQGDFECQIFRIATAEGANGVVRQTGGRVTVTDSLIASSHQGRPELSIYELSNGMLNIGHHLILGQLGDSHFTLNGSRSIVTADQMILGQSAVLTFVLDSDGAGLIKLRNTFLRHPGARLVIDGSQYRGGEKTVPLVVCGSSLTNQGRFADSEVHFEGFDGMTPRLAFRPGAIDLVIAAGK